MLKATAEAQLFVTLFVTVVLRTNLIKDTLTADDYGGILVAALMATPSVEVLFIIMTGLAMLGICNTVTRAQTKQEQASLDLVPAGKSVQASPAPDMEVSAERSNQP